MSAPPAEGRLEQWIRQLSDARLDFTDASAFDCAVLDILAEVATLRQARETLRVALEGLIIDANRLCDRSLGGTYEEDCQRSIRTARAALAATTPEAEK